MLNPFNISCSLILLALCVFPINTQAKEFSLVKSRKPAVRAAQDETPVQPELVIVEDADLAPPIAPALNGLYNIPDPQIMGADDPIKVGELVDLWVESDEDSEEYSAKYSWTVLPAKDVVVWPDGKRIIFGTGTTQMTYVIVLTASYVFADEDPDGNITGIVQETVTKVKAVQITGGVVIPPPIPGDGGNGNGGTTGGNNGDGLAGLAKSSYEWVSLIDLSTTYSLAKSKADAAKLAVSFRAIADKIKSGEYNNITTILAKTKESNDAAIANRDNWLPWFTKMSQYLQAAYGDGSIRTNAQFEQAWRDIADGLDAASR